MNLPAISPLSDRATGPVDVPPPPSFRPLVGRPRSISVGASRVQTQIHPAMSIAKANGIRYEWQVYEWLYDGLGCKDRPVHIQHCIRFSDDNGYRTVIPDAFVVLDELVFLFEVKSQHMPETWWQCEKLYKPLLEELFKRPVFCIEIVKTFDPQIPFPCEFVMLEDLKGYVNQTHVLGSDPDAWPSQWSVFKWRKKTT